MAQMNPQAKPPEVQNQDVKEPSEGDPIEEQIQHLKKVILNLQRKHHCTPKVAGVKPQQSREYSEAESLKKKPLSYDEPQSRLAFGSQFKKEINHHFRARVVGKKYRVGTDKESEAAHGEREPEEGQKSIIDLVQGDCSQVESEKRDWQEEEPVKTQRLKPYLRDQNHQSSQFHFRKKDWIPAIQEQKTKFYNHLNTYRQTNAVLKGRRQQPWASTSMNQAFTSSQPDLSQKGISKQGFSFQNLLEINLKASSSKQEVIEVGQRIFSHFLPFNPEARNFTIKKYKNCIVFSLMPNITKAAVWYYNQELYFGNISLNEEGKVQRNGVGIQWVRKRHFYEGYFVNSKKNGRGKILYENGDQYDGQWNEGHIYGFGRYTDRNNKVFEGFWRNGHYEGTSFTSTLQQFNFP